MDTDKRNGFSLVELIVVIAIMGVLMVLLAPQYLKYVEKSRLQKDNAMIGEVAESIKAACANEVVADWILDRPRPVKFSFVGGAGDNKSLVLDKNSSSELEKELTKVLPEGMHTSSRTYQSSSTPPVVNVDIDAGAFMVTVDGFIAEPAGGTTTRQY